jgi:hypothetical protein
MAPGGEDVHGEVRRLVVILDEQNAGAPSGICGGHGRSLRDQGTVPVARQVQNGCTAP